MKRSTSVILVMTGTAALAGYMATRPPKCDPNEAWRTEPCPAQSSSSSSRSRGFFWSSGTSSGTTAQPATARGGFGHTGSAVSSSAG